ncbi:MAG: hypothetical protein IPP93_07410 [Chitinophagaceae bacterium]|nr:hypothetical protein [Chitinophagaceae bacterium]MBL0335089.1 hypothetical protein [Chitinophagaceae bacterium]
MKKVFAIAFFAAATLVACNNSSEKKAGEGDTTKTDTVTAPVTTPDTAATTTPDTAAAKMDTAVAPK